MNEEFENDIDECEKSTTSNYIWNENGVCINESMHTVEANKCRAYISWAEKDGNWFYGCEYILKNQGMGSGVYCGNSEKFSNVDECKQAAWKYLKYRLDQIKDDKNAQILSEMISEFIDGQKDQPELF